MFSAGFLGWAIVFWIAAALGFMLGFTNAAAVAFSVANVLGVISLSLAILFVILRKTTKLRAVSRQASLTRPQGVFLPGYLRRWLEAVGLL